MDEIVKVVQRDDYYPFVLTFNSYTSGVHNLYKYQTKELQQEIAMYDFHARFYDPALGRTSTHDPHSDGYYNLSPYGWVGNNPIRTVNPDGKDFKDIIRGVEKLPIRFENAGSKIVKGFFEAGKNTKPQLERICNTTEKNSDL